MIFTRDGTWVRAIIWFDHATDRVEFVVRYHDWTEEWKTAPVSELRADGGLPEILDAAIERRNRPR